MKPGTVSKTMKIISVCFFATATGHEPVKLSLQRLNKKDRFIAGTAIKTVELGWPLGMPLVRKLNEGQGQGLWEVRIRLSNNTIARVLFTVARENIILLHAFIKKSQAIPKADLKLADSRRKQVIKEK